MASHKVLPFVQKVWKAFQDNAGHDARVLSGLKVVDATKGRVHCRLPVEKGHLNRVQTIHGGVLGTIVDSAGLFATGVSTDLNVTYIASAKLGDVLDIDARLIKLGKTLAFTDVEIRNGDKIVVQGRHTKFVAQAYQHELNENID